LLNDDLDAAVCGSPPARTGRGDSAMFWAVRCGEFLRVVDGQQRLDWGMTKILLTRHGHVEGIHPARFRGRAELPLTDLGLAQADALARRIAAHWKPMAVYTSPRQRCVVTGAKIAAACGISASVHEGLGDIDYGTWQMRTHEEVKAETPVAYQLWRESPHLVRFPGGESLQDVVARTSDALRAMLAQHANDTVVMVGHDSVNRALLLQLLDQPLSAYWRLSQDPCTLNEIEVFAAGDVRVGFINDTSHLLT
jgi:broad specificity phosphatase PhoE